MILEKSPMGALEAAAASNPRHDAASGIGRTGQSAAVGEPGDLGVNHLRSSRRSCQERLRSAGR